MENELTQTLDTFISKTSRSKVAVIVPLYGYWSDVKDNFLNLQTLKLTMDRINSSAHNVYIFFVGEAARVPKDIQNFIIAHQQGGNSASVAVPLNASYAEYIREGMNVAHDTTDSAYFISVNPWLIIQPNSIDVMVDRMNFGDDAKIISGYDLRTLVDPEKFDPVEFDSFFYSAPKEERAMDCSFFGLARYALETSPIDINIRTSHYLERDMWQCMYAKGFEVIVSQRIPMFVFDVNLKSIEDPADVEADKQYFQSKWGFLPSL